MEMCDKGKWLRSDGECVRWAVKLPCGPLHHAGKVLTRQIALAGSVQREPREVGPWSKVIAAHSCHLALCNVYQTLLWNEKDEMKLKIYCLFLWHSEHAHLFLWPYTPGAILQPLSSYSTVSGLRLKKKNPSASVFKLKSGQVLP